MDYTVRIKKRVLKTLEKVPVSVQEKFALLAKDLRSTGAIQNKWANFSALDKDKYHCHLGYSWVACWQWERGTFLVEVYYVGSRENAPY